MREIVAPTVAGMAKRGAPFRGVLFVGLMVGADGPKVIEFNVRFGDPETEAILARLDDDLLEFLLGCARGAAPDRAPRFSDDAALTVIMAARGYPGVAAEGDADPRPRGRGAARRAYRSCTPARAATASGWSPTAAAFSRSPRSAATSPRRSGAPTPPSTRSTGPGGFCRRDIGWRAVAPNEGRMNGRGRRAELRPAGRTRGTDRRHCARQRRRARLRPYRRARSASTNSASRRRRSPARRSAR